MKKSNKRDRRKAVVRQLSSIPLYVVAGLPIGVAQAAVKVVESLLGGGVHVISIPTGASDEGFYTQHYVNQTLSATAAFAHRRRATVSTSPTPKFVVLCYVPSEDEENLVGSFDFFAFPIPLSALALRDMKGKLLRHNEEQAAEVLRDSLGRSGRFWTQLQIILERITTNRQTDAIALPPRNFHVTEDTRLSALFREMRRGARAWTDRYSELDLRECSHADFEAAIPKGKKLRAFRDSRELVFLRAGATAYHGPAREIDSANPAQAEAVLASLYRFGGALPPGFHHDVQFSNGRRLNAEEFDCREQGRIKVSGGHANIYPNDYVRPEK